MQETRLILPLALIALGALLAALSGLPAINRRLNLARAGWLLALAPLGAFGALLWLLPGLVETPALSWRLPWMPSLGLSFSLYLDSLSALFALLVTGIGALVVVYAGAYFAGDRSAWRFLTYIFLFMLAMLGLVLAGDVITLFLFWEATSVTSFLLVAYKYKDESARQGAFKALLITGGGGVALLFGLLLVAALAGGSDWTTILAAGPELRASPFYLLALALVALGALTKSAQAPFHIWLPNAMSAPTPASAYLHSATMVKAGIYLLARMNPALGGTETWFWLFTLVGMSTMLLGAYLGLKQNDLKALLAYSTISQLGVLVMMIGQDSDIAFKALAVGVLAHALYKSALFLAVGSVDHLTGTRQLPRLGGLARWMPFTFAAAAIAGLSMAGLPPLFGFLAKETLLATAIHPSLPPLIAFIFPLAAVAAGALMLAQSGLLVVDTFLGRSRSEPPAHSERYLAAGHWLAPLVPALLSLAVGVLPEPQRLAQLLAGAASAAYGAPVKVSLALWTGLNVPLALSVVAITIGAVLFWQRARVRAWQAGVLPGFSANAGYEAYLAVIERGAYAATRLQNGKLRRYLALMLSAVGLLLLFFGQLPLPDLAQLTWPTFDSSSALALLRIFILLLTIGAAFASILLRRDLFAVLAVSVVGLNIAVLMAMEPAPDVALVQVVVDILATVILVLTLTRLPRAQRQRASMFTFLQSPASLVRDALLALGGGLVMTLVTLTALISRPRASLVTPYYESNAKVLTGAQDIVGAVVVDFRAFDTLIEISVFAVAGLGVYSLLRYAANRQAAGGARLGDGTRPAAQPSPAAQNAQPSERQPTLGIGGRRTSPFVHALAYAALPLSFTLAVVQVMYGHDQPGDGFTAGVTLSLAVAFWYVVFGYDETKRYLPWLQPGGLIVGGITLALLSGIASQAIAGSFLAYVDYGALLGLTMPAGLSLSSALLFELAISLTVLGSATFILDTLGHPAEQDEECSQMMEEILEHERQVIAQDVAVEQGEDEIQDEEELALEGV